MIVPNISNNKCYDDGYC